MLYLPGRDIEKRINDHIYFPIGKNYDQTNFVNQLYEIFPSKVKNATNLDLPYILQEARMENKYLIADFYTSDEEVIVTLN
jgi:hypothetical protein